MSKVVFTRRGLKDLEKIDPPSQRRILEKVQTYSQDPLAHATKLVDQRIGSYRYRIGDFRVVFDLEDDTIFVLRVGHRREIYS